jgi:hypothetical protein
MPAAEPQIRIVKRSLQGTEAEARIIAEIDSHMMILRHYSAFASRQTAPYLYREMMTVTQDLKRRFGSELDGRP